jgi:hypothetical protein
VLVVCRVGLDDDDLEEEDDGVAVNGYLEAGVTLEERHNQEQAFRSRLHLGFRPIKDPHGEMTTCFKAAVNAGLFPKDAPEWQTTKQQEGKYGPTETKHGTAALPRVGQRKSAQRFADKVDLWKRELAQFKKNLHKTGNTTMPRFDCVL